MNNNNHGYLKVGNLGNNNNINNNSDFTDFEGDTDHIDSSTFNNRRNNNNDDNDDDDDYSDNDGYSRRQQQQQQQQPQQHPQHRFLSRPRKPLSQKINEFFDSDAEAVRHKSIESILCSPFYIIIFFSTLFLLFLSYSAFLFPFGFRPFSTLYPQYPTNELIQRSERVVQYNVPDYDDNGTIIPGETFQWEKNAFHIATIHSATESILSNPHQQKKQRYLFGAIPDFNKPLQTIEQHDNLFPFLYGNNTLSHTLQSILPSWLYASKPVVNTIELKPQNESNQQQQQQQQQLEKEKENKDDENKNKITTSPNLSPMAALTEPSTPQPPLTNSNNHNPFGYITACLPPVTSPLFPIAFRSLLFISKRTKRTILLMDEQPTTLTNSYNQSWGMRYSELHWRFAEFLYKYSPTNPNSIDEDVLKRVKNTLRNEARNTIPFFSRAGLSFTPDTINLQSLFDMTQIPYLGGQNKVLNDIEFIQTPDKDFFQSKCSNINTFHICFGKKNFSKIQKDGVVFDTCDDNVSNVDSGYRCTNCGFHVDERLPKFTYLRQQVANINQSGQSNEQQKGKNNNNNNNTKKRASGDDDNVDDDDNKNKKDKKSFLYQFLSGHFANFTSTPYNTTHTDPTQQTKERITIDEYPQFGHYPAEIQTTSIKDFEHLVFGDASKQDLSSTTLKMIHMNSFTLTTYGFYLQYQQSLRPNKELRMLLNYFPTFHNLIRFEALQIQHSLVGIAQAQTQPPSEKQKLLREKKRQQSHDGEYLNGPMFKPASLLPETTTTMSDLADQVQHNEQKHDIFDLMFQALADDIENDLIAQTEAENNNTNNDKTTPADNTNGKDANKKTNDNNNDSSPTTNNNDSTPKDSVNTDDKNNNADPTPPTNPDEEIDDWYHEWDPRHPNHNNNGADDDVDLNDLEEFDTEDLVEIEEESSGGTIKHWWYDVKRDQFYEEEEDDNEEKDKSGKKKDKNVDNKKSDDDDGKGNSNKGQNRKIYLIDKNGNRVLIDTKKNKDNNQDDSSHQNEEETENGDKSTKGDDDTNYSAIVPPPRNKKLIPVPVGSVCGLIYNVPPKSTQIYQYQNFGQYSPLYQIAQWLALKQCAVAYVHSHSLNPKNENKYNKENFVKMVNGMVKQFNVELYKDNGASSKENADNTTPQTDAKTTPMVITQDNEDNKPKQSLFLNPETRPPIDFMWGCMDSTLCGHNNSFEFGVSVELLSAIPHILIYPANYAYLTSKNDMNNHIAQGVDSVDPVTDAVIFRRLARKTMGSVEWIDVAFESDEVDSNNDDINTP